VDGGVTIADRVPFGRAKECGRITCKRSESSRVSLKSQPLIKPILSLDSAASLIATPSGDLWDYGLYFITTLFLNLKEVWISGGRAGPPLAGAHIRAMDDPTRLAHPLSAIDNIREDFASLDDWEDRYRYVLELGHSLEPLSEEAHNDGNKVRGCVSQVWLEREPRTNAEGGSVLHYRGDSDSHLVRGLIAITVALFSDRTPEQILAVDANAAFRELGLEQHLTPQRSNGVRSMVDRIRKDAAGLKLGAA
jgi:cysteine desulfuration protein SufE